MIRTDKRRERSVVVQKGQLSPLFSDAHFITLLLFLSRNRKEEEEEEEEDKERERNSTTRLE
jgi:hypothetical protein